MVVDCLRSDDIYTKLFWEKMCYSQSGIDILAPKFQFAHHTQALIESCNNLEHKSDKKLLICLPSEVSFSYEIFLENTGQNKQKNKQHNNKDFFWECWLSSVLFYLNMEKSDCIIATLVTDSCGDNRAKSNNSEHSRENLMSFINNSEVSKIINFTDNIVFVEDKFQYKSYSCVNSININKLIAEPNLNRQVLLDLIELFC